MQFDRIRGNNAQKYTDEFFSIAYNKSEKGGCPESFPWEHHRHKSEEKLKILLLNVLRVIMQIRELLIG